MIEERGTICRIEGLAVRCFVAIELDDAWCHALVHLMPSAKSRGGVRWVTADSLHLTLWFLGELESAVLPQLSAALQETSTRVAPFELAVDRIDCFPSRGHPRVVWVGARDAADACCRWIATAAPLLIPLGYPADERPFQPHITLARARDDAGGAILRDAATRLHPPALEPLVVRSLTLFESRLNLADKRGPRYRVLSKYPLGARLQSN